jgi:DNA-directed RNA polymerase subunit RPC12/RpoP
MVDDQLHVNQKTQALIDLGQLGLAALGLWTVVGSKVQAQGSDGQVLPSSWRLVGDKRLFIKLAGVLVDVGLWENERDTDDAGWQYHDWFDIGYSPAEKVKLNRKRTKEMKNPDIVNAVKARDGDRCRYCGHKVDWKNRTGDYGATYDHVTPGLAAGVGNLVVACRKCNRQKAQRTPDQAGMPLLPPPNGPDSAAADGTRSGPENLVPDQVSDQVSDQKPASPLKAGNRSGPGSGPGEQRGDDEVTAGVAGPAGRPPDISPSPGHTGSPWHGHRGPPPNVDEPRCPIHNLDMPCRKCTADHYSDEVSP